MFCLGFSGYGLVLFLAVLCMYVFGQEHLTILNIFLN